MPRKARPSETVLRFHIHERCHYVRNEYNRSTKTYSPVRYDCFIKAHMSDKLLIGWYDHLGVCHIMKVSPTALEKR